MKDEQTELESAIAWAKPAITADDAVRKIFPPQLGDPPTSADHLRVFVATAEWRLQQLSRCATHQHHRAGMCAEVLEWDDAGERVIRRCHEKATHIGDFNNFCDAHARGRGLIK